MSKVVLITGASSGMGKLTTAYFFVPVGGEAEIFVPLRRALSDKAFEQKVKETFGI